MTHLAFGKPEIVGSTTHVHFDNSAVVSKKKKKKFKKST